MCGVHIVRKCEPLMKTETALSATQISKSNNFEAGTGNEPLVLELNLM
jgi:hypothetical protein